MAMRTGRHDGKKRERRARRKERAVETERRAEQNRGWRAASRARHRAADLASGIAFVVTLVAGCALTREYLPGYFRAMFPAHHARAFRRPLQHLGAILDVPLWIVAFVVAIVTWFAASAIANAVKRRRDASDSEPAAGEPAQR